MMVYHTDAFDQIVGGSVRRLRRFGDGVARLLERQDFCLNVVLRQKMAEFFFVRVGHGQQVSSAPLSKVFAPTLKPVVGRSVEKTNQCESRSTWFHYQTEKPHPQYRLKVFLYVELTHQNQSILLRNLPNLT